VLRDDINADMKEAMKAGQALRVSTLRLINAAILARETSGAERVKLGDAEIVDVMQKMVKQRQESFDIYEKAPSSPRRSARRSRSSPNICPTRCRTSRPRPSSRR
jgi:uncharacterized protein YqeY